MGQEINNTHFSKADFQTFHTHLRQETEALADLIKNRLCSHKDPVAGFEIEAWLVDDAMNPVSRNEEFLASFNSPLASAELAKFNIELNNDPVSLKNDALSILHKDLENTWNTACSAANSIGCHLLMVGTLPTLKQSVLNLDNMSGLKRYRALNEQILRLRGKPLHLTFTGRESLSVDHDDVMMESATTSFQIHLQAPLDQAHHFYNAAIMASAPSIAISANSPYLFGKDLWCETRIPLFEQSIEVGGYDGAAQGPVRRVSFGTQYARKSIMECFQINLDHFPVLLPMKFAKNHHQFEYLRLHNGTIWRWNRPLVGFDTDGTAHIRIEHRVIPAGPSIIDMIANAAFFYGLAIALSENSMLPVPKMPFSQAKDNFYQAARHGLDASIVWQDGKKYKLQTLLQKELIDMAYRGLESLAISSSDAKTYLDIIEKRNTSGQTGCQWQRRYINQNNSDFHAMTAAYFRHQRSGRPVHSWAMD